MDSDSNIYYMVYSARGGLPPISWMHQGKELRDVTGFALKYVRDNHKLIVPSCVVGMYLHIYLAGHVYEGGAPGLQSHRRSLAKNDVSMIINVWFDEDRAFEAKYVARQLIAVVLDSIFECLTRIRAKLKELPESIAYDEAIDSMSSLRDSNNVDAWIDHMTEVYRPTLPEKGGTIG